MGKRGQSTTFVLIGLVLLVLVIGLSLTSRDLGKKARETEISKGVSVPAQVRPVYDLVSECVKDTGKTGIYLLALQGGYIEPEKFLETDMTRVGYGYYVGQKTLPSKEKMSAELGKFMDSMLQECAEFASFRDMNIEAGKISTRLLIEPDDTRIEVYYPLEIEKDEAAFKLNDKYSVNYPIKFGKVYDFASKIVDMEIQNKDQIDLTFLLESGFDVTLLPVDNDNIIYSITDKESEINNVPFTFMFANKF